MYFLADDKLLKAEISSSSKRFKFCSHDLGTQFELTT